MTVMLDPWNDQQRELLKWLENAPDHKTYEQIKELRQLVLVSYPGARYRKPIISRAKD